MAKANKLIIKKTDGVTVDSENYLITTNPQTKIVVTANTDELEPNEIANIRWICSTFTGRPKNLEYHASFKGKKIWFSISKAATGGGLIWLEAVAPNKEPTYKAPYGYFVNTIGTPSIDRVEWREYQSDNKGAIVKDKKFFGEGIQLHIYTSGLYGHDIEVSLLDKNLVYSDKILLLDKDIKDETNKPVKHFQREVKKLKSVKIPEIYQQKVIINVRADMQWIKEGKVLEVYPIVKPLLKDAKPTSFKDTIVVIKKREQKERALISATKSGNKPVKIGNIATDTADFKPCFYTKIITSYTFKDDEEKTRETKATIYDSNSSLKPKKMSFAVVAGPREGKRKVKIELDTDTSYCLFEQNEKLKHEGRVLNFSNIEDAIVLKDSASPAKESKPKEKNINETIFKQIDSGNEGKWGKVFGSVDVDSVIGGFKRYTEKSLAVNNDKYCKEASSDTEVNIGIPYKYGKNTDNERLKDLVAYIWPASASNIQQYQISIQTCRQKKVVLNIDAYPDIRWTLQFCYNTDPEEFNKIRGQYKDYKVRLEKVNEDAKETYDHKIDRNKDLADKYDKMSKEVKGNKAKSERKIKKFERQLKKASGAEKKKLKNKKNEAIKRKENLNKLQTKYKNKKNEYEEKITKHEKSKAKYQKKERKKANKDPELSKQRPDLYDFDDNLEHGISDITLALWAEWDRPTEKFEITAGYQKYVEMLKTVLKFKKIVDDIFGGKKEGNIDKKGKKYNSKNPKPKKKELDSTEADREKKLKAILGLFKLKPLMSVNIIPPSVALACSWHAANPKNSHQNEIGTTIDINAIFDPIIGAEIVLNFMALVEKSHPLVKVALTILELGGFEIRLDLTVSGVVFCKGHIFYNTATGENNIMPGDFKDLKDPTTDSPLVLGGRIEMEVYAGIKFTKKYEAWSYEAVIELNAYASVVTGITISGSVEWVKDNNNYPDGIYLNPILKFHGLTVTIAAKGKGEFGKVGSDESIAEIDGEVGGEYVVMDPYEAELDMKIPLGRC